MLCRVLLVFAQWNKSSVKCTLMSEIGPVNQVKKIPRNPLWCSIILLGKDKRPLGAWYILLRFVVHCQRFMPILNAALLNLLDCSLMLVPSAPQHHITGGLCQTRNVPVSHFSSIHHLHADHQKLFARQMNDVTTYNARLVWLLNFTSLCIMLGVAS